MISGKVATAPGEEGHGPPTQLPNNDPTARGGGNSWSLKLKTWPEYIQWQLLSYQYHLKLPPHSPVGETGVSGTKSGRREKLAPWDHRSDAYLRASLYEVARLPLALLLCAVGRGHRAFALLLVRPPLAFIHVSIGMNELAVACVWTQKN